MALNKPVRQIAIVGTGVIGASWAAEFLAHGFDVVATDPAPNAEQNLRKYIDAAWPALTAKGLAKKASRERLTFSPDLKATVSRADLVQENGPERPDFKIKLFAEIDAATPTDSIIASSSSGITMSVTQSACAHPERCVIGHPFNPPHMVPLVEVVGGAEDFARSSPPRDRVLRIDRQEADSPSQRSRRARCQSASGRRLSRGCEPDPPRRSRCGRRRHGSLLGTRVALGRHGAQLCCSIWPVAKAEFSISWITFRVPSLRGGKISAGLLTGLKAARKRSSKASRKSPTAARSTNWPSSAMRCCWNWSRFG